MLASFNTPIPDWWAARVPFFASGSDSKVSDLDGQPYTTLLYSNGPGYTQPRNILREAGKDSIQVKEKEKKKKEEKEKREKRTAGSYCSSVAKISPRCLLDRKMVELKYRGHV